MKKRYLIPLIILMVLLGIRIYLPFWVTGYVNRTIEDIPEYTGGIEDVDINLYRGAYKIDNLNIDRIEDDDEIPFISIPQIDLSIQWGALFNGAMVGEVEFWGPGFNFVTTDEDTVDYGQNVDWTQPVKELMPVRINRFAIRNGTVRYVDPFAEPQVDISLEQMDLDILNISNAENIEEDLPSHIEMRATSIGEGQLYLTADANIIQEIPDVDLTMEFEKVHLPALNNFLEAYAGVDVEQGVFNLYTDFVINDGMLDGALRPIITDLEVVDLEDGEGNILQAAWEGIVGAVTEIFKNHPTDRFATEVPIDGDLNNVETGVFPTIWNIFRNTFVESFSMEPPGDIQFGSDGEEESSEEEGGPR